MTLCSGDGRPRLREDLDKCCGRGGTEPIDGLWPCKEDAGELARDGTVGVGDLDGIVGTGDWSGVSKSNSGLEVMVGGMAGIAGELSKAEKSQILLAALVVEALGFIDAVAAWSLSSFVETASRVVLVSGAFASDVALAVLKLAKDPFKLALNTVLAG